MAEAAALGAGLQVLFGKVLDALCRYTGHTYRLLGGVNQDLEELKITLERFQEMLKNDGAKVFRNEATRKWYHRVRCAVNDADGILEDGDEILEGTLDSDDDHKHRVCHPFPTLFKFDGVWNRGKVGERIKVVLQKLNGLEVEKSKLSFEEIDLMLNRETVSVSSKQVFGRDGEKEKIIDVLLNDANTQNSDPHIYAIIGMGGIGKTTLAQLIYNDTRMVENFEHRIWVWVSQNFDVKLVMEKIIETLSGKTGTFKSLETTQNHLKKLLCDKKFLLVLDDIWNENQDEWNKLKSSLNFGAPGSSILLTTRGSDVASTARAQVQHTIKVLSEENCWQVFKESAFLEENEENGQLEVIGKQIAKKCGGLPLAAKSLGGSLRLTRRVGEWESIRNSHIWELPQPCEILPALKLSLDSLKSYSRDCFTFCCVFPKGYYMEKDELVQLWMANDLIPSHPRLELEDMGNKILNDLVLKSFFQVASFRRNCVTMHDLMHDLGLSFRTECFCLQGPDVSKIPTQCQHLVFIESPYPSRAANVLQTLSKSHSSLRTLLTPFSWRYGRDKKIIFKNLDCSSFFSNLQCLRALDLSGTKIEDLPKSIGKIKDLKYLNLDEQECLTHVPDSICALTKLQTLKLRGCMSLTRLPDGITRLINLRHLDLNGCEKLTCLPGEIARLVNLRHLNMWNCKGLTHLPDGIGRLINLVHLNISDLNVNLTRLLNGMDKLVNLQRLELYEFALGMENGQRISDIQGLNSLTGFLTITGLEHVRDTREAEAAFLNNKKNLSTLGLIWGDLHASNSNSDHNVEGVLEALKPPQSLHNLLIKGYDGSVFASWIKLLENLVRIELRDCTNCERLPPLGQLPLLEALAIVGMNSLKCINTEFYGSNASSGNNSSSERGTVIFPSLQKLYIVNMPNLEEWQGIERDSQQTDPCPCLEELILEKCPKLKSLPSEILNFVRDLRIKGSDKVIVRSLPRLTLLDCEQLKLFSADFQYLTNLQTIFISKLPELRSLSELHHLISLRELHLTGLPNLTSVTALQHLSKLKQLTIISCKGLKRLSPQDTQNLILLEYLDLVDCGQLEFSSTDFHHLINLRTIILGYLPELISIPHLQHISTLQKLRITSCKSLTSLWPQTLQQNLTVHLKMLALEDCEQLKLSSADFQHLIKLQKIRLLKLPELRSLPELQHLRSLDSLLIHDCKNLKELPQWLQNLTSLQTLKITGCGHDLESRCAEDSGEYWPFIKHIPDVRVGDFRLIR